MFIKSSIVCFALLASSVSAAPSNKTATAPAKCVVPNKKPTVLAPKAVYFLTNNEKNAVFAIRVGRDGKLGGGQGTPTTGKGGISIDAATKKPAASDGLVSQSSIVVSGRNLFAVNAGDNTVSMFRIDPKDPAKLTLVAKPVAVPGDFPNTISVNAKNQIACVGHTGAKAGVACAGFNPTTGLSKFTTLALFDLKQSNPPVGPTNTVSQVFWSADGNTLFTTVKGDPAKKNIGFLASYKMAVEPSKKKAGDTTIVFTEQRSAVNGTAVLFGAQAIPGTKDIFTTDASFGAGILSVDEGAKAKLKSKTEIKGQKATCWVTISGKTRSAFVTDVGVPKIVEMDIKTSAIKGEIDVKGTKATGLIDLKASGNFLYALAPGKDKTPSQVIVVDISKGSKGAKVIQTVDVGKLGAGNNVQGMTVF